MPKPPKMKWAIKMSVMKTSEGGTGTGYEQRNLSKEVKGAKVYAYHSPYVGQVILDIRTPDKKTMAKVHAWMKKNSPSNLLGDNNVRIFLKHDIERVGEED